MSQLFKGSATLPLHAAMVLSMLQGCGSSLESRSAGGASESAAFSLATPTSGETRVTVRAPIGEIVGQRVGNVDSFRGIRYAYAPVGALRLAPPRPIELSTQPILALSPGSVCPQNANVEGNETVIGAEDCLFLNVWRPAEASAAPRPVMVFIHGGGFQTGSGITPGAGAELYDGTKLAALGNVILVTINYRLGALGFMAHDAYTDAGFVAGNYGILDQIEALKWVRANAAAFGGDAANVTIFGESAGAMSTCTQVAQNLAPGLFKRAIMQSGNCQARTVAEARAEAASLVNKLQCQRSSRVATRECLASKSASSFVSLQPEMAVTDYAINPAFKLPWAPTIDGRLYSKSPLAILEAGEHQKVDMVIGNNRFEIPSFLFAKVRRESDMFPILRATGMTNAQVSQVLQAYPASSGSPAERMGAIATDIQFSCPTLRLSRAMHKGGNRIFNFRFDQLGAFHAVELLYVFQYVAAEAHPSMVPMGQLWTAFGRSGNPSAPGQATWTPFSPASPNRLVIGDGLAVAPNDRVNACAVLEFTSAAVH